MSFFESGRRALSGLVLPVAAVLLVATPAATPVVASEYPDHPVRFIVSYPPGGPADILARTLANDLGPRLGQQVVIDNRGGANGNIGAQVAARAAADGYTLFMVTSSHAANVTLYRSLGYDLGKDFTHVTNIASYPLVLVVHPDVQARSVGELVALAKAKPGSLTYASGGTGGGAHLAGALFASQAGIELLHVPYKGTAPGLLDVVSGQVNMMFAGVSAAMPYVATGQLRAIGVSSPRRLSTAPELPTIKESGLPDYEVASWLGVSVPAGTPEPIVERLNAEIAEVVKTPAFVERLAQDGSEPQVGTPRDFDAYVASEVSKWAKVIRDSGTRVDDR